jgi:hypothetical protein
MQPVAYMSAFDSNHLPEWRRAALLVALSDGFERK